MKVHDNAFSSMRHGAGAVPICTMLGIALWLAAAAWLRVGPFDLVWAKLLLVFSPLVLVPIGLRLAQGDHESSLLKVVTLLQCPAAIALTISMLAMQQGWASAALALPWFLVTVVIAFFGAADAWRRRATADVPSLSFDAGLVYLAVGGAWAVLDRAAIRPLDFEPVIVLLTAIHFHFAGFVLPVVAGLVASQHRGRLGKLACLGVVAGMPLVALGITATQLGFSPALESVAAVWMAGSGSLTAGLLLQRSIRGPEIWPVRSLLGIGGAALAIGMVLAAMYGLRPWLAWAWLDIPLMRATHGTLAALGFAFPVFLAWLFIRQPAGRRS